MREHDVNQSERKERKREFVRTTRRETRNEKRHAQSRLFVLRIPIDIR